MQRVKTQVNERDNQIQEALNELKKLGVGARNVKLLQRRQHGRGDQSLPNEDTTGFN